MWRVRTFAAVSALTLGAVSGWLTARAGGSVERAPTALLVMAIGLGGTAAFLGILLGTVDDATGAIFIVVVVLLSYYLATWIGSPFHSLVGDSVFMVVASIPAATATAVGYPAGRAVARMRRARHVREPDRGW